MRILVIDDDDDVRALVVLALRGMTDHEVVGEAGTVDEALQQARALDPDLVVTDLVNSVDGPPGLLSQLRGAAPSARIVVFSGMPRREGTPLPDGADDYVVKGGRLDSLLAAVDRAVDP